MLRNPHPKGEKNGPLGPSPYLRRRVWIEILASKPFCRNAQWNFPSLRREARIETRHPLFIHVHISPRFGKSSIVPRLLTKFGKKPPERSQAPNLPPVPSA